MAGIEFGDLDKVLECKAEAFEPLSKEAGKDPKDNWAHRSQGMRCGTCMFFAEKQTPSVRCIGRCRRHAPTMGGWPVVFPSDWCGDHKLDETKI